MHFDKCANLRLTRYSLWLHEQNRCIYMYFLARLTTQATNRDTHEDPDQIYTIHAHIFTICEDSDQIYTIHAHIFTICTCIRVYKFGCAYVFIADFCWVQCADLPIAFTLFVNKWILKIQWDYREDSTTALCSFLLQQKGINTVIHAASCN